MRKIVTGVCLVAVLVAGGVAVLVANKDKPAEKERSAQAESRNASTGSGGNQLIAPSAPDPSDPEQVKRLKEVNQVIFEVTQEALNRPKDKRMTPEEISALVRSRIQELAAHRQ